MITTLPVRKPVCFLAPIIDLLSTRLFPSWANSNWLWNVVSELVERLRAASSTRCVSDLCCCFQITESTIYISLILPVALSAGHTPSCTLLDSTPRCSPAQDLHTVETRGTAAELCRWYSDTLLVTFHISYGYRETTQNMKLLNDLVKNFELFDIINYLQTNNTELHLNSKKWQKRFQNLLERIFKTE